MKLRRSPIESLAVDEFVFAVRWSARRRSIGLTVKRDGSLVVAAPVGTSPRRVESVVRAKLPWVRRKLAEFERLGPPAAPRRFTDGERLPYLGRRYRLARVEHARAPVGLRHGRFELAHDLDGDARAAIVDWYIKMAHLRVEQAVSRFAPRVGATPAEVVVRDIGRRRWGVCDHRTRSVRLHWQLVALPPQALDYVVLHELCHLHEPNHSAAFWHRVLKVMPDAKDRRRWLSRHGQDYVV